jgi:prevent-host-death family protein
MIKRFSATTAKNNFGMIVEEVDSKGNEVIIEKNRKPIMKISSIRKELKLRELTDKDFEDIRKGMKEFRKNFKFSF